MIRATTHAGTFYPRFEEQLRRQIAVWLKDAAPEKDKQRSLGLILPHAGYMYSGQCAALGLHSISHENVDSFIILHPSHHGYHFDFSLSPYTEYNTPLGSLKLNRQLYDKLSPYASQDIDLSYHQNEHSMEIQLPLISYFYPHATVLPIMIGNQIPGVAKRLAELLNDALYRSTQRIVILCSTDLSHYHKASKAEALDAMLIEKVLALDPAGLWDAAVKEQCEACGLGAILSLLYVAGYYTAPEVKLINYTHSGNVSGDNQQVVGYMAAKICI
jgi:hypothetical protein